MKLADLFTLIREAALAFGQDKAPRLAAAIAYYAMFSIAPLLLFAVAIAGRFLTDATVIEQLFGTGSLIYQNLGPDAADFLQKLVPNPATLLKGSTIATGVAFAVLFMGATGLFVQLQDALNSLWGAEPAPPLGVLNIVKTRLISFVMIIFIGLLLIAFLALNTYLSAIAHDLVDNLGFGASLIRLGTSILSALFLSPIFAAIYLVLPDVKLEWREVWVGGVVTATLFTLGQYLIGLYFGRAAPGSVFGAAASLVLLLLWIYYSAMIFFFGAEVTWVYSQKFGTHAGGATNVAKKEALAAQGAQIDVRPSEQELGAMQRSNHPLRNTRGRLLNVPLPKLPRLLPRVPRKEEGRLLPTVRATLWNAVTALLAVPVVVILRIIGLTGGKRKDR